MIQHIAKRTNFETLALIHLRGLYRTARYVTENESDAQDLVMESFTNAYYSWSECRLGTDCRRYLFRTMADILNIDFKPPLILSKIAGSTDIIDEYLTWYPLQIDDFGQNLFSTISENDVRQAITNLPENVKFIIVLSLLEGFSYREIAEIAGISMDTVRFILHQGRKLLQIDLLHHVVHVSDNVFLQEMCEEKEIEL